ncbi:MULTISPECIES: endonuclease III domain-containing protein [Oceanotoga]|uniref:Endonuclease III n=1 Tax=Oceanotoga teriensis TaxID=515440 RepID=A0AA45C5F3_9BACT|nr:MULTISPECIES: endonuclease III [Oceanotoga]MDN5342291.1 endonuclease [Oceanotoga sp.]MDO7977354.1 endonuclease III [Oceanotoga teriensis]PWJ88744.1 DNA-(apurinic or apyrimidinic site) lyase /endonuclease III [Oceanotoga teriensis]
MRNFNKEAKIIIENYPYYHENTDPYVVLVSTVLSQRTKDENTDKATKQLFSVFKDVFEISKVNPESLYDLIKPAGMFKQKSERIVKLSKILVNKYNGNVPNDLEKLLELPGVGRKTANIVLYVSFGLNAMAVDTHVHRISNRLGWISTKKPEDSEFALMKIINKDLWGPLNGSMVAFGQKTCRPKKPLCSKCPLNFICPFLKLNKNPE